MIHNCTDSIQQYILKKLLNIYIIAADDLVDKLWRLCCCCSDEKVSGSKVKQRKNTQGSKQWWRKEVEEEEQYISVWMNVLIKNL